MQLKGDMCCGITKNKDGLVNENCWRAGVEIILEH